MTDDKDIWAEGSQFCDVTPEFQKWWGRVLKSMEDRVGRGKLLDAEIRMYPETYAELLEEYKKRSKDGND